MNKLKIVADQNMPLVEELFSHLGEVRLLSGREIHRANIKDAEILLVRSVTQVNRSLLEGSAVRFVGSATAGTDHIDLEYLANHGIQFAYAAGCNAEAVVQYVFSVMCSLTADWQQKNVGIVGCGNVGGRLYRRLRDLNVRCRVYDPFLDRARVPDLCSFAEVLDCDIISVHTPLTSDGPYPTFHLFDKKVLQQIKPSTLLINAGRGAVVDNRALLAILKAGVDLQVALDVWESEPQIDLELMALVSVATPHIAGYSNDGKIRGTSMLFNSLSDHYPLDKRLGGNVRAEVGGELNLLNKDLNQALLSCYNVYEDDQRLRAALKSPEVEVSSAFDNLRKNYPQRREFSHYRVATSLPISKQLATLGFSIA